MEVWQVQPSKHRFTLNLKSLNYEIYCDSDVFCFSTHAIWHDGGIVDSFFNNVVIGVEGVISSIPFFSGSHIIGFYSVQWRIAKHNQDDVKVTYLGVYQDVKMIFNISAIILNRIRKRLNGTFHNLIEVTENRVKPQEDLIWPSLN